MSSGRLEAFSDGVIAILITIMVLELKVPHGADLESVRPLLPVFLTYVLSYVFIGIYWNNHHHLLHTCDQISGRILWANLHLLFWLSLVPVVTGWMGDNHTAALPTATYGVVMVLTGVAYMFLEQAIIARQGQRSKLAAAVGKDVKARMSVLLYVVAIAAAFYNPWISDALYVCVPAMWLVPDKRIEALLSSQ
jgi:uncharacterized membrane protein